jgi:hypothetical protein
LILLNETRHDIGRYQVQGHDEGHWSEVGEDAFWCVSTMELDEVVYFPAISYKMQEQPQRISRSQHDVLNLGRN